MDTGVPQPNIPMTVINPTSPAAPTGVPVGVKIIAILFYIAAVFLIFLGVVAAFISSLSLSYLGSFGISTGLVPGLAGIVWGVLSFFTGRGLWSGQQWGKVLTITISGLYIIYAIVGWVMLGGTNYISLVINLIIVVYLIFSKGVSSTFQEGKSTGAIVTPSVLAIIVYAVMVYPSLTPQQTALNQLNQITNQLRQNQKLYQSSSNEQSQNNTTNIDSPNKKVYFNSTHNFQFTYPSNNTLTEDNQESRLSYYDVWIREPSQLPVLYMRIRPTNGATLDTLVNEVNSQNVYTYQKTDAQVAGEPAIRVDINQNGVAQGTDYDFIHDGYFYRLSGTVGNPQSDNFEAIVKSFEFTK